MGVVCEKKIAEPTFKSHYFIEYQKVQGTLSYNLMNWT